MEEDGIDLTGHRSRPVTEELLERASVVLTMTLSQARQIEKMNPRYARKTHLLTSFPGAVSGSADDIEDPIGGSQETYRLIYGRIKRELERILPLLVLGPDRWPR
jgi:protein-tyrosine-phosphatase